MRTPLGDGRPNHNRRVRRALAIRADFTTLDGPDPALAADVRPLTPCFVTSMSESRSRIVYTRTDEAPALATASWLPVVEAFARACDVEIELRDISLAARVLAAFPDFLAADQQMGDALAELGALTRSPDANIIKLPNISASVPQLQATITELQERGYPVPDYPESADDERSREIRARYDRIKGSAVNPVLREGNSDRRAPAAVKQFARHHPHSMGAWSADSRSHVATMSADDFFHNEQSVTVPAAGNLRIELVQEDGTIRLLREAVPVTVGEIIDASLMRKTALVRFLQEQVADARQQGILFSLHLKATMMKVSDPIIFGHAVRVFFADVFAQYATALEAAGVNPNNGLGDILADLDQLPEGEAAGIRAAFQRALDEGPSLAMVNSDQGITNLHVPSDVIVDASMPAMIRNSGQMWDADGQSRDTKAVIPDSSYAGIYEAVIRFCKEHGAFDPTTMGTVPNVGLMAMKAEEYGSHDKTFEIPQPGTVRVVDPAGATLLEHGVRTGDIWRMCQTREAAVVDWVGLAIRRARATGWPAVFWLDRDRPHDREILKVVEPALQDTDTGGLQIEIMKPVDAMQFTLERLRAGENTISVTGNVLRDYLTDLFPILELGTSAKMLSIVPLMKGGGLFETGAGGSAPKHVQQFLEENHLRWDSLGEFLALAVSLEHLAEVSHNRRARILAEALDTATGRLLENRKSPSRKVGELDNRGSHFYLALYWAEALATRTDDPELASRFAGLAEELSDHQQTIVDELNAVQGQPVDIAGYYWPDPARVEDSMRPSSTFNAALRAFSGSAVS